MTRIALDESDSGELVAHIPSPPPPPVSPVLGRWFSAAALCRASFLRCGCEPGSWQQVPIQFDKSLLSMAALCGRTWLEKTCDSGGQ